MTNKQPIIAVVENDPSMIKAIERLLRTYGYASETFTSAELYLERKNQEQVSCLLLDVNLDGISGIELQKKLVETKTAPPIIVITGQGDEPVCSQAIDLGCIAFLHKPFESHALRSALNAALNGLEQEA